ncbi:hypothetical protein EDB81DRAFT_370132 [Dactylonectria macrodidyma]|uniref:Protein kinase domain-containing protein n=1 Tax=Dactylonectria macrodidyma TaxID=307937 RepID=A0A9P9D132_9HYPO|nr:hypothetical protein EDB81DRAFT_370132 [Dactylonectria macrodidyma]
MKMQTESNSHIWDSRSTDNAPATSSAISRTNSKAGLEADNLLQDILATVRNGLPYVIPEFLSFDSQLGRGSSFEVTREVFSKPAGDQPHFVAVKRLVMRRQSDSMEEPAADECRRLMSVKREVRVLTHSKLQSHPNIISAVAWGLTPNTGGSKWPYLVMSYSDMGTLAHFSQMRIHSVLERRLLARDVAMGIRALHDCNIVHGDVKPENVLVFGSLTRMEEHEPSCLAKVADFGCTLFEDDINLQHARYLGTPKYNAPEIRGLLRDSDQDEKSPDLMSAFTRFKAADCYSFGLLLWETTKYGKSFIDSSWLENGEQSIAFLERSFYSKENALLGLASDFFEHWQVSLATIDGGGSELTVRSLPSNPTRLQMQGTLNEFRKHLDPIDAPPDDETFQALRNTISLCLQDSIWKRGNIHQIVEALGEGLKSGLPLGGSSTHKVLPQTLPTNGSSPYLNPRYEMIRKLTPEESPGFRFLGLDKSSSALVRAVPLDTPADSSRQVVRMPAPKRIETLALAPQGYCYGPEDMFKAASSRQPPWDSQCAAANYIQHAIETETDEEKKAQAHLQLSIMYQIGYGVAPDSLEALSLLEAASQHNQVAKAIHRRLRVALMPESEEQHDNTEVANHTTCTNPYIFLDGILETRSNEGGQLLTFGPISVQSFKAMSILVNRGRYKTFELAEAFADACKKGYFDAAKLLATQCRDFYTIKTTQPNPLHWLIMFSPEEAVDLLKALLYAPTEPEKNYLLKSIQYFLPFQPEMSVFLPHRCLELRGTPLHWATAAGYQGLVRALLALGADANTRTQWRRTSHQDGYQEHHPSLSPLDIASAYHYPDIVELLLDHGSEVYGGDSHWSLSPMHMLGYHMLPFARYVAHGQHYRTALRKTIKFLTSRGLDINSLDSHEQTPLFVAVKNMDLEPYVLEELLSAGALPGARCVEVDGNIVISAVICCDHRRFSGWKIPLLLPLVQDVNAQAPGASGLNALHHCALFDAAPAGQVLLQCPEIDIHAASASRDTDALCFAAQRGSLGMLALLISKGASLTSGRAMTSAVCFGQIEAVSMLLDAGAGLHCALSFESKMNILSYAVCTASKRPSHVRRCLARCPRLREKDSLDATDAGDWTALHSAAYYGDFDAVSALLNAGADCQKLSSLGETPLDLVLITLEEFIAIDSRIRKEHPRIKEDLSGLDVTGPDFLDKTRGIEMSFSDSLDKVVGLLRQAELNTHPGEHGLMPRRQPMRKPNVGTRPRPTMSREVFAQLMYGDVK